MAADIVLADCIVPIDHDYQATRIYGANICFDCKNACGNCEWSEVGPETGKIRFQPVPGWTATGVEYQPTLRQRAIKTYHITDCPKYKPLARETKTKTGGVAIPVIGTSLHGEVRRFETMEDAAKFAGVAASNIYAALKGKSKTSGGYRWEYAEDEE
jgi:hypothetical protein